MFSWYAEGSVDLLAAESIYEAQFKTKVSKIKK